MTKDRGGAFKAGSFGQEAGEEPEEKFNLVRKMQPSADIYINI